KKGLFTVRVNLKLGDISADDLIKISNIAKEHSRGLVRTTQLQNILITSVSIENIDKLISALKNLSVDVFLAGPELVACTGAATCKLGLCLSRGLANTISEKLNHTISEASTIRISGCPNSCGHHYIADVGFQGKAKRVNGRLMPCYDVLVEAKTNEGEACLAKRIGTVPAKVIPDLLVAAFKDGKFDQNRFKELTRKHDDFSIQFPEDYFYDYGSEQPFSLAGRGPGECGAGVMDVMKVDIDEAKQAVKAAQKATG
ncbi:MAG: hypothetical protein ACYSUL_03415, partial [Planctomycetota bacterium]